MNPTMLIRSAVAVLASTTLLLAQSASAGPTPPRAAKQPSAVNTERLQVRLAEVIAMLDEDDLTPEQRSMAKKKLEEIASKLRAAQTSTPIPFVPAPPPAAEPPMELELVDVTPAPRAPREARRARVVAPEAVEVFETEALAEPKPPQDPASAEPPKPPKAPKARRAVRVVAPDSAASELEGLRLRVLHEAKAGALKELEPIELKAEALELRKAAENMRAEVELLQPQILRLRHAEKAKAEADESAGVSKQWRARVVEVPENDGPAGQHRYRELVMAERAHADAARAHGQAVSEALDKALEEHLRVIPGRASEAQRAEGRVLLGRALDQAVDTQAKPSQNLRWGSRVAPTRKAAADDDIRQIVDEMRAEMREIRELLQELRKQSQANATKTRTKFGGSFGGGMGASAPDNPPVLGDLPLISNLFRNANEPAPDTAPSSFGSGMSGAATRPARSARRAQERGK